jgi:hypothetical protein
MARLRKIPQAGAVSPNADTPQYEGKAVRVNPMNA